MYGRIKENMTNIPFSIKTNVETDWIIEKTSEMAEKILNSKYLLILGLLNLINEAPLLQLLYLVLNNVIFIIHIILLFSFRL